MNMENLIAALLHGAATGEWSPVPAGMLTAKTLMLPTRAKEPIIHYVANAVHLRTLPPGLLTFENMTLPRPDGVTPYRIFRRIELTEGNLDRIPDDLRKQCFSYYHDLDPRPLGQRFRDCAESGDWAGIPQELIREENALVEDAEGFHAAYIAARAGMLKFIPKILRGDAAMIKPVKVKTVFGGLSDNALTVAVQDNWEQVPCGLLERHWQSIDPIVWASTRVQMQKAAESFEMN